MCGSHPQSITSEMFSKHLPPVMQLTKADQIGE